MMLVLSKRQKFIVTSLLLSIGFIFINLTDFIPRFLSINILGLLAIASFYWSLKEGIGKDFTLLTLILPYFYTLGVGIFWFLIPSSIYTKIPVVLFYGGGIYALCLTNNIFTVSSIRTIALLRAARAVGFVFTLITIFLIFDAIFSLKENIIITSLLAFVSTLLIIHQGLWVVTLDRNFSLKLLSYSLIFSLINAQIAFILYFWPVKVIVGSLFLTLSSYIALGLGQASLEERLFKKTVSEYLLLGISVFIGMFLATKWSG